MEMAGGSLTPTAAESVQRSKRFHAHIAQQAAKVVVPTSRTYFVPNVPFGKPKQTPRPRLRPIDWAVHCRSMWFYDLVWPAFPNDINSRLDLIINTVARHFCLSKLDIRSRRRSAKEVIPRQLAMLLCRELTTRSLPEIGRRLGGKDHTTVIHGIRQSRSRLATNPELATRFEAIKLELMP